MTLGFSRRGFLGIKFRCAICDQPYRRFEMILQRGKLVCRETCIDTPVRTKTNKG